MKRVLVTGGAGYKGCVLVPKLLAKGYEVVVYDILIFGKDGLPTHPSLEIVEADIRDTRSFSASVDGCDAVIHMACIANDPSFELNPGLSKAINYDCFEDMVKASVRGGVQRFIYVSTSSVYGVSDAPKVTEDHPLLPITDYNKYKGMCEPVLFKHQSPTFTTVAVRPATVCGYSPRMRLDLTVNILTSHAVNNGRITVFGGEQKRPNIHIEDITDLYVSLLELPKEKLAGETFNAGYQNHSVMEIAEIVKKTVQTDLPKIGAIEIVQTDSDDIRSYHVCSDKVAERLGFVPQRSIEDAVRDVCAAFRSGRLPNSMTDPRYYNVKYMKEADFV